MKKLALLLFVFLMVFPLAAQDAAFYYNRGFDYLNKNDLDRAIADFGRAISLRPNDPAMWFTRGIAYGVKEQWDQSIQDLTECLRIKPDFLDAKDMLFEIYSLRGNTYLINGEYVKAIEDFSNAITLNRNEVEIWNNRGRAYVSIGEVDRGIEDLSNALTLNSNFVQAYNNRGIAFRTKGELGKALADFSKAIALDKNALAPLINRGQIYSDMGNLDLAIADFTKIIDLDPKVVGAWNNRGIAYCAKGRFDLAIADFGRAIALNPNDASLWNNRGIAYKDNAQLDKAIEDYNKAISLNPNEADFWINLGNAYYGKKDLNRALSNYRRSIEAADKSDNFLEMFSVSWDFTGIIYNGYPFLNDKIYSDNYDIQLAGLAREAISRSISKSEKARATLGSRGAEIMTALLYQYYAGVDFEARFGSAETAFTYSEGLRSRGFLEQMGTRAALKLPGVNPADAQRVLDLINEIDNLWKLQISLDPQMEAERHAQTGSALVRAESSLESLDAQISARVPRYKELRNPKPASLAQAKAFCGSDKAVLEFVIWDSSVEFKAPSTVKGQSGYKDLPSINSYCLVITRNGVTPVRLEPGFDYAAAINRLRDNIKNKASNAVMERDRNALYNALIKPALSSIPANVKDLIIVPDGILGHLPFDILRENDRSQDFGEKYRITLSPSVSVSVLAAKTTQLQNVPIMAFGGAWYSKDKAAENRGRPVAIESAASSGGAINKIWKDLPGTETEVRNLQRLVSSQQNIRVFTGREVSEAQVKSLSAQRELVRYPILHFACHGHFDERDPERSGIVFSEVSGLVNTGEDGYLTIPEIILLNLNARMVLLSACETGLGVLKREDGMVGMARAFLVSGVENVGVSLWSIDDEATMEFMTRLYGKVLNEGKTFKEAYYLTKNEFRKDPKWSHPYYWAAFTMYE